MKRFSLALGAVVAGAALAVTPAVAGHAAADNGCSAGATIGSQWGSGTTGGQVLTVTVVNTAAVTTQKWTVTWTLPAGQELAQGWNAAVTASGREVTAVNNSYNGALAPGASALFGVRLVGIGPSPDLHCDSGIPAPPSSAPPSSAPPSSAPPGPADVTVGEADYGTTVTLTAGQTLGVSLPAQYRPPTVVGSAVAPVSTSGGYPTGQPLAALYRAVTPGSADIVTQTDDPCFHATPPCARPVRQWLVHVTVLPAGRTVTVTTADHQGTVRLGVGDTLVVSLTAEYLPPALSRPGVLTLRDVTGGYSTGAPLVARYTATAAGTVDVSTRTDYPCSHTSPPCPMPWRPWLVHVIVS